MSSRKARCRRSAASSYITSAVTVRGIGERVLADDLAADLATHFPRLVRAYQDRLFAFALRLAGNPLDAEECLQDAFVRAYRALERYPSEQIGALQIQAWLYRITLNVVRNRARRH